MSEPSRPRPVPGPPPGAAPPPADTRPVEEPTTTDATAPESAAASAPAAFADLDQRPVTEHVDVFEAEHTRLERELRTIDQL